MQPGIPPEAYPVLGFVLQAPGFRHGAYSQVGRVSNCCRGTWREGTGVLALNFPRECVRAVNQAKGGHVPVRL